MNTEIKKEKKSLEGFLSKYFVESKLSTLNVFLFTLICIVLSRLIMFFIYSTWFNGNHGSFLGAMAGIWDNGWYGSIILDGYPTVPSGHEDGNAASWAFFPLSPMTVRWVSQLLKLDYRLSGFLINNLFFAVAMLISYKYVMLTRNSAKKAIIFILVMTFGPNNFYFSCFYTEALFFLLTIWFLYELARERYLLMGVAGALLSATRVTGVFIVFSVLIYLINKHIREKQGSFGIFCKNIFLNSKLLLGVCIVPAGLFAYMLYLHIHVGDALAFTHIQKAWGRDGSYLLNLLKALLNIGNALSLGTPNVLTAETPSLNSFKEILHWLVNNSFTSIYYTSIFVVIILVTVYTVRKSRAHETVPYVFPCAINVLTLGFVNLSRYSSGTGIFILNIIDIIEDKFPKPLRIAVYVVLALASFMLQALWFDSHPLTIG